MPIIAGSIMAGGALLGGGIGYMGQSNAADQAADVQRDIFAATNRNQAPYRAAGNQALNTLMSLYGINAGLPTDGGYRGGTVGAATPEQMQAAMAQFYASPEYTLQKSALDQALERQAAATGTMYSPSTALGQAEIAGRTFGDWRNNMAGFASMGPQGAQMQATNLQNLGSGLTSSAMAQGQAMAGLGNTIGSTISGIGQQYGQYSAYNNQMNQLRSLYSGMPNQAVGGSYNINAPVPTYSAPPMPVFSG